MRSLLTVPLFLCLTVLLSGGMPDDAPAADIPIMCEISPVVIISPDGSIPYTVLVGVGAGVCDPVVGSAVECTSSTEMGQIGVKIKRHIVSVECRQDSFLRRDWQTAVDSTTTA